MDYFERFAREIHGLLRNRPSGLEIKPHLNEIGLACSYRVTLHLSADESLQVEEPKLMAAVSAMCRRLSARGCEPPKRPALATIHCVDCGRLAEVALEGTLERARRCLECWQKVGVDNDTLRRGFSV